MWSVVTSLKRLLATCFPGLDAGQAQHRWKVQISWHDIYFWLQVYLGDEEYAGDEGDDPLGDVMCMECGRGDDEDNLLLCDGMHSFIAIMSLSIQCEIAADPLAT